VSGFRHRPLNVEMEDRLGSYSLFRYSNQTHREAASRLRSIWPDTRQDYGRHGGPNDVGQE